MSEIEIEKYVLSMLGNMVIKCGKSIHRINEELGEPYDEEATEMINEAVRLMQGANDE